jgi:xylulokinase
MNEEMAAISREMFNGNNQSIFIGIDSSTKGDKSFLVGGSGKVRSLRLHLRNTALKAFPLWSEQAPQLWWNATVESIRQAVKGAANCAAGRTRNRLTAEAWAGDLGSGLGKCCGGILWHDQRTQRQCDLYSRGDRQRKKSFNSRKRAQTGFTAPKSCGAHEDQKSIEKLPMFCCPRLRAPENDRLKNA